MSVGLSQNSERKWRHEPSYVVQASIVESALENTQVPRTLAKTSDTVSPLSERLRC